MLEETCEEKERNFASSLNYKYKNFKYFILIFVVSYIILNSAAID